MTYFVVSCERNATEFETADQLRVFFEDIGCDGVRVWASKGSALSPSRGEWRWAASNTDAAIRAARDAGSKVVYLTLVGAPANGTLEGKITFECGYTNSAFSWTRDPETGDAHEPAYFNPDQPWMRDPDCVDPIWSYDFGQQAVRRYYVRPWVEKGEPPVVHGLLIWNEPDDRTYNPRMMPPYEAEWNIYRKYIYAPIVAGARTYGAQLPPALRPVIHGPETAYISGLEAMLSAEAEHVRTGGSHYSDVITFHNYGVRSAEDGGEPGETLSNAIKNLEEKLHIVDPYRDGRMIGLSEGGDQGTGWWPEYIEYAVKVAGDYLLYIDYNPKQEWLAYEIKSDTGETIIKPNAQAIAAAKMMASLRKEQQRRRPSGGAE